jgi:O-antigen biosynthesis protein
MYPESWRVTPASYEHWAGRRDQSLAKAPAVGEGPRVSVVMPVYNTDLQFLASAIESVRAQKYRNWQLCIADDASTDPGVAALLQRFAALDQRIRVTQLDANAGIAGASNRAAELADGEFVALMDHDDVLHPEALNVVVRELARFPEVKFLYTDSDHLDANGRRCNPFFKPGYDYSRFLGQNYLNHLTVIRRDLLKECQGWKAGYEGSQDYELYLRVIEKIDESEILHVPEVLYHWRDVPGSVARSNLGRAVQAARLAIRHHFERAGIDAGVKGCPHAILYNRIEWPLPTAGVQLVLYGDCRSDLEEARSALSGAGEQLPLHISPIVGTGNQRELIAALNEIVSTSESDFLCFMDARLRPASKEWLQRLASIADRAEVGIVTGKLLRSDGRLASGPDHGAGSGPPGEPPLWLERENSKGYIASLCLDQEVAAVPPELLFAKTSLLRRLQGLPAHCDSLDAAVRLLCRRVTDQGQRVIWSPHVLFRFCGDDEQSPWGEPADGAVGYGASIQARLAANPHNGEVEWEAVWKESAE